MLRVVVSASLVAFLALAGCTSDAKAPVQDERFPELVVTKETGIIRGVIVNSAIVPLPGVKVVAMHENGNATEAVTDGQGVFGMDKLEPGIYVITAEKAGYLPATGTSDVKAGVVDPAIVKITMLVDEATKPYAMMLHWEGYIECSGRFVVVGAAVCSIVNIVVENGTADEFSTTYEFTRVPTYLQSEMVWESTQMAGDEMSLAYSWDGGCGLLCDHEVAGKSPLILQANQTVIDTIGIGTVNDLFLRVFNEPINGTNTGPCVDTPPGTPLLSRVCQGGVGLTLQQKFDVYTTVFYGFAPPETYRFTNGDPLPQPPL